jgi:anaerobic ribonucleoside-triphosphate reductase
MIIISTFPLIGQFELFNFDEVNKNYLKRYQNEIVRYAKANKVNYQEGPMITSYVNADYRKFQHEIIKIITGEVWD